MLQSKLYGAVILVSFRNFAQEMRFQNEELTTRFADLKKNTLKVEVQGPSVIKGVPGRKERLTVCHLDNLIMLNVSPALGKSDPLNCYHYLRASTNPQKALADLIDAIVKQLKLTQASVVVDRLELMTALFGPEETLKFIKVIKHQGT